MSWMKTSLSGNPLKGVVPLSLGLWVLLEGVEWADVSLGRVARREVREGDWKDEGQDLVKVQSAT